MGAAWYALYFVLGLLCYLYFIKVYFYLLSKNKLIAKKVNIKNQKFLWGEESYWTNNKLYMAKNIFLKRKTILTKKFHKNTVKTFFIVSGRMDLFVEKGNSSHVIKLFVDDAYEIYPETSYSISAITDVKYIEVSNYVANDTYSHKKKENDRQRYRNFTRKNN